MSDTTAKNPLNIVPLPGPENTYGLVRALEPKAIKSVNWGI